MLTPFSPYCADFQIRTLDTATGELTLYPRRPVGELSKSRLNKMLPAGVLVSAIALYSDFDSCVHDHLRWFEKMLGYNLVLIKQRSRGYKDLFDAILVPCPGPRVYAARRYRDGYKLGMG